MHVGPTAPAIWIVSEGAAIGRVSRRCARRASARDLIDDGRQMQTGIEEEEGGREERSRRLKLYGSAFGAIIRTDLRRTAV